MRFFAVINRVSEFFFLLFGVLYLFAFLSWRNNFYSFETEIILRLGDLPLALFGLLFAFTSIRISLADTYLYSDKKPNGWDTLFDFIMLMLALGIFAALVYVDLMLPNKFPFPKLQ